MTPTRVSRIAHAGSEASSFVRAEILLKNIARHEVDTRTIQRIALPVGGEPAQWRDADPGRGRPLSTTPTAPPELAAVEGDDRRIRTRLPGHGPGVHFSGRGLARINERVPDQGVTEDV